MSPPARIVCFGGAGLLVLAGALCAALVSGGTGQILALVLIGLGLVLATALVFLEIGLSEDRQRAREEREQARRRPRQAPRSPNRLKPPSLGRARDHRRRLR
jgi:hypothetical protein